MQQPFGRAAGSEAARGSAAPARGLGAKFLSLGAFLVAATLQAGCATLPPAPASTAVGNVACTGCGYPCGYCCGSGCASMVDSIASSASSGGSLPAVPAMPMSPAQPAEQPFSAQRY